MQGLEFYGRTDKSLGIYSQDSSSAEMLTKEIKSNLARKLLKMTASSCINNIVTGRGVDQPRPPYLSLGSLACGAATRKSKKHHGRKFWT